MPGQSADGYLDKFKHLFTSPSTFFENVKGEGMQNALLTYLATLIFSQVIGAIQLLLLPSLFYGRGGMPGATSPFGSMLSFGLFMIPFQLIITLLFAFTYTGAVFLLAKLFKGEGGYSDSFKAVAYSLVPYNIISIVPFIGWLSIFYSIVLIVIGVKKLHNISTGKAVTAVLLPALVFMVLLALIISSIIILLVHSYYSPVMIA